MASSEGFLTDGQREILKKASQDVENLSSSPKSPSSLLSEFHHVGAPSGGGKAQTAGHAARNVRQSHPGKYGRAKKDGAGGKGTCGKLLDTDGESRIDKNDPNYDSHKSIEPVEEDIISNLQNDIIEQILGRLTMPDIGRITCVSKNWKRHSASFFLSFPYVNIDNCHFNHLSLNQFKDTMHEKVMTMKEECLVIYRFRLRMDTTYMIKARKEIYDCTSLIFQTGKVKELDFQITFFDLSGIGMNWDQLLRHMYNAETLLILRLGGLVLTPPIDPIKFSDLKILRLDDVYAEESLIDNLFNSCPLLSEISLVRCYPLEHLKVCGNLGHLRQLEVCFCPWLERVNIQAKNLEKLVVKGCSNLVLEEIKAPNSASFFFE